MNEIPNDVSSNLINQNEDETSSVVNSSLNSSNVKKRVQRYCPKIEDIKFNLMCEWISDCNKKTFTNMDAYLDHIDQHLDAYCSKINLNDKQTYECEWEGCDSDSFDCESTFKRHVRFHAFHTKLKQIGFNVLQCLHDKQKNSKEPQNAPKCNLDEQTRNVIPELPYKFECSWDYCDYTTDNPELFYRHIKINHVDKYTPKEPNSKCKWSQCEQKLPNKNRLVEHMRHHSQEKLVACPNCGALFASFTKFIDHCSRSSEIGNLCFQCSHCNKKFATNNLLKEHIRKHINKFKCPICDMTCIDKNDLSKHILYKHTTHKAFTCSICDHSCKTQHDLQRHINLKHNERYEYQCNECEFKSKDLNNIKKHMLKFHLNGEGSYIVNDGQQFSTSYMCHVCNKVYCQGSTLSRHLKTSHNFQWPSGHSRFRYKLESDGYYRLQTLRYESVELVEELNKNANKSTENNSIESFTNNNNYLNNAIHETTSSLEETPNPSENNLNMIAINANSLLDSTGSNTLNDLTNQTIQINININNLIHFTEIEQIQNQEQNQNQTGSTSNSNYHQLINLNENNKIVKNQKNENNQEDDDDVDDSEQDEDMELDQDNVEYEILNNQNYLVEANSLQRPIMDVGDRIEFDLENFLNSNFHVKVQNIEEKDVEYCYQNKEQDDFIEYKSVNLIDN